MWFVFCISIAFSQPKGVEFIDQGDRFWGQREYKNAKRAWKEAAKSAEPATKAMAEYRLMLTASNITLAIHGFRGDTALNRCSFEDPWCLLARVDRDIVLKTLGFPIECAWTVATHR